MDRKRGADCRLPRHGAAEHPAPREEVTARFSRQQILDAAERRRRIVGDQRVFRKRVERGQHGCVERQRRARALCENLGTRRLPAGLARSRHAPTHCPYQPEPGQPAKAVVLIEDNGPIHTSKLSLAARAHWLTVEWLPKFAPELNDVEVVWHDLKAHHLAHQTFADPDALNQAIHHAVKALNSERMALPLARPRISPRKRATAPRTVRVMRPESRVLLSVT